MTNPFSFDQFLFVDSYFLEKKIRRCIKHREQFPEFITHLKSPSAMHLAIATTASSATLW